MAGVKTNRTKSVYLLFGNVHHVQAGPFAHELHDQPQLILMHERRVAAQHIWVVAHTHYRHLKENHKHTKLMKHKKKALVAVQLVSIIM